jgi:hypothetical protein
MSHQEAQPIRIEIRLGHFLEVDVLGIARFVHEVIKPFASRSRSTRMSA